jgi:hypothetical protein
MAIFILQSVYGYIGFFGTLKGLLSLTHSLSCAYFVSFDL